MIAKCCILVAMMLIFVATVYAQQTQQVFSVTRVYVNTNNLPNVAQRRRPIRQDGTAQVLQFWSRSCDNTFPSVRNIQNGTTTGGNNQFCSLMPLSMFAIPQAGSCGAASCQIYSEGVGGGLGGGFGPGQIPAPGSGSLPIGGNATASQYVSITTYTALESSPGSVSFPGQAATGTNAGVAYCPGSAAITSTFIFQSGACVLAPNITAVDNSTTNAQRIFTNYRAFYALCTANNGLLIKGCVDTQCQNCFVVTDASGCSQFSPSPLTGYINYQGCGLGRASGTASGGTTTGNGTTTDV